MLWWMLWGYLAVNTIVMIGIILYLWYDSKVSIDLGEAIIRKQIREGKWKTTTYTPAVMGEEIPLPDDADWERVNYPTLEEDRERGFIKANAPNQGF